MHSVRAALLFIIAALWSGIILVLYFTTYPLNVAYYSEEFFSQFSQQYASVPWWYLRDLAFLAVILLVSLTIGRFILRLLRLNELASFERHIFEIIIGLESLALATFLFGVVGLLYSAFFYVWILGLLVVGLPGVISLFKFRSRSQNRDGAQGLRIFAVVILCVLFFIGFLYTLAPPIQSDGMRYHLAAPQEYIKHHHIYYIPLNAFTNFPFLIEMLFMLGMLVSSDLLAKLLHFTCLVLTCLLLAALWRRFLHRGENNSNAAESPKRLLDTQELLCILIFASTPAVLIVSCWSFIDAGIVLFFVAMLYSLLLWADTQQKRYLWLLGITAGGALGTKYTMIVFVLLALGVVFFISYFSSKLRSERHVTISRALRNVLIPAIIAFALASPWYVKNIINTGNPVYPLAYGLFDGGDWSRANEAFYQAKAAEKGFPHTLRYALTVPFDTAFSWLRFEAFNIGVGYLLFTPFMFAFPLWLWRKRRLARTDAILFIFAIAYIVLWYFTYQSNRFLIPLFAILSLLIVYFLEHLRKLLPIAYAILLVALLAATLHNFIWSVRWILAEATPSPMPVVLGFEQRDHYLTRALDYYPCFQYLNSHVKKGEKVLFVGEHRGYYCGVDHLASDWFDTPYILYIIRQTGDNEELFRWFDNHSVRYVFFNFREMSLYWRTYFRPRLSQTEYDRFLDFVRSKRLEKVFSLADDMYVCEIKP